MRKMEIFYSQQVFLFLRLQLLVTSYLAHFNYRSLLIVFLFQHQPFVLGLACPFEVMILVLLRCFDDDYL